MKIIRQLAEFLGNLIIVFIAYHSVKTHILLHSMKVYERLFNYHSCVYTLAESNEALSPTNFSRGVKGPLRLVIAVAAARGNCWLPHRAQFAPSAHASCSCIIVGKSARARDEKYCLRYLISDNKAPGRGNCARHAWGMKSREKAWWNCIKREGSDGGQVDWTGKMSLGVGQCQEASEDDQTA